MKRILSLILCTALVFGTLSCSISCLALGQDLYLVNMVQNITFERPGNFYKLQCPNHSPSGSVKIGNADGTDYNTYNNSFMYQSGTTNTGNGSSTTAFSFTVPSGYNTFTGTVGVCYDINDTSVYNGRHRIRIFVNNAQKYISPLLAVKHGYTFNVPVKSSDKVMVEVYGAGSTNNGHVCFGSAALTEKSYERATVVFDKEAAAAGTEISADVSDCTVQNPSITYNWYVDEVFKSTGTSYTVNQDDMGKTLKCVATEATNGVIGQKTMFLTNLPQMCINTETGADVENKVDYVNSELRVYGNEKFGPQGFSWYNGNAKIRGRGNSSWTFRKKSYKLKLDDKTAFFGMEKSKHWLLIAGCYDEAQMRNKVVYDFSGEMGMTYMQSEWVNLVLNGQDYGTYLLCEQVRVAKGRVDIKNWEGVAEDVADAIAEKDPTLDGGKLEDALVENLNWISTGSVTFAGNTYKISDYYTGSLSDISGGYIVQMEYDPAKNEPEDVSQFQSSYGLKFNIKDPEYTVTNTNMYNYIKSSICNFENACLSADFTTTVGGKKYKYSDLADMDSLVKNFLCNEIFYNPDAGYNSNYICKDTGGKLTFGPVWDFDTSAAGKGGAGSTDYNFWQVNKFSRANKDGLVVQSVWYKKLITDMDFVNAVYNTYHTYRTKLEEYIKPGGLYQQYYDYLKADLKENTDLWYYKSGYQEDYNAMTGWMNNRVAWLDEQFNSVGKLYASLNGSTELKNQISISASDLSGKSVASGGNIAYRQGLKLTATASNFETRYITLIINGKKFATAEADYVDYNATFSISPEYLTAAVGGSNLIIAEGRADEDGDLISKAVFTLVRLPAKSSCTHISSHRVVMNKKYASCTAAGYTGDTVCADCGKIIAAGKVIAKKSHSYSYYKTTKNPTYFSYGSKISTCNVCHNRGTFTISKLVLKTPQSFTAYSTSYKSVKLTWKKVSGASGYVIYRKTTGSYKKLKTITKGTVLSYTNSGLSTGKKYTYCIKAYVKSGTSVAYSKYTSGKSVKPLPSKPTLTLAAKSGTKAAYISWKKVSGAFGYTIQMATKKGGKYKTIKTVTSGKTLKYTKKSLTKGKTYYFKVRAYRKVSGKKYYGSFCTAKAKKIK